MPRQELPAPYKVLKILDSRAPCGARLTTWALTYPRFVHAELMTHRMFSRNSASSRAIPSEKMRQMIIATPALPVWWGKNQAGMQAKEELDNTERRNAPDALPETRPEHWLTDRERAKQLWLEARNLMIKYSDELARLGLHKQLCNRLTEPWMPITVLVSATNFGNWFHLRDHKDAQPEIQVIATEMHYQYLESRPQELKVGEWHLPYCGDEEWAAAREMAAQSPNGDIIDKNVGALWILRKVSTGRCARVSYLTHEGKRDLEKDVELHNKLLATTQAEDPAHLSPFEHVAEALEHRQRIGNFIGWKQLRKFYEGEAGPEESL